MAAPPPRKNFSTGKRIDVGMSWSYSSFRKFETRADSRGVILKWSRTKKQGLKHKLQIKNKDVWVSKVKY